MAYERLLDNQDDDLQKQLEQQLQPEPMRTFQPGGLSTQPVGGATPMSDAQTFGPGGATRPPGARPLADVQNDFMNDPRHQGLSPQARQGAFGGLMSLGMGGGAPGGGLSTQPVGGATPLSPGAGGAMASGLHDAFKQSVANNYTDIAGTENWKAGQYLGQLEGFNHGGWGSGERGSNTLKNSVGKVASDYDVKQPGALRKVAADPRIQELTGGKAMVVEHPNGDLIDFDGDGPMKPVDMIRGATAGGQGEAWQWGVDEGGGGGAAGGGIGGTGIPGSVAGLLGMDPMSRITSEVDKLMGGRDKDEQSLIEQILAEGRV